MGLTLLSIFLSGVLFVIFRSYRRYRIHILQTIVVNYWVCVLLGVLTTTGYFSAAQAMPQGAWAMAATQGILFMSLFFLIGYASQHIGVAFTVMLTKMSVILPTLVSWVVYDEAMPWERWLGIGLALLAVYLLQRPYLKGEKKDARNVLIISVILLIGTGLADTLLKVFDHNYGKQVGPMVYTISVFGSAATAGTLVLLTGWLRGQGRPQARNLLSGLGLGIPNYFSLVVLLMALQVVVGTIFFPLNNIGQLLFVSLAGILLFGERFPRSSWLGLGLAIFSLLLISWRGIF